MLAGDVPSVLHDEHGHAQDVLRHDDEDDDLRDADDDDLRLHADDGLHRLTTGA
jgi:hypothetical protein